MESVDSPALSEASEVPHDLDAGCGVPAAPEADVGSSSSFTVVVCEFDIDIGCVVKQQVLIHTPHTQLGDHL